MSFGIQGNDHTMNAVISIREGDISWSFILRMDGFLEDIKWYKIKPYKPLIEGKGERLVPESVMTQFLKEYDEFMESIKR